MAAHPSISNGDATQIANWILSLASPASVKKSMPANGTYVPLKDQKPGAVLVISASYTDQGGNNIKPLTGSGHVVLLSNQMTFSGKELVQGFVGMSFGGMRIMLIPPSGWFAMENMDLTGVKSISLMIGWQDAPAAGIDFEIHDGASDGALIGSGKLSVPKAGDKGGVARITLKTPLPGRHQLYFVCKTGGPMQAAVSRVIFE
jgi:hypothetical protein